MHVAMWRVEQLVPERMRALEQLVLRAVRRVEQLVPRRVRSMERLLLGGSLRPRARGGRGAVCPWSGCCSAEAYGLGPGWAPDWRPGYGHGGGGGEPGYSGYGHGGD